MDRLIFENILSDVHEISLSEEASVDGYDAVVLMNYKAESDTQLNYAFNELRKVIGEHQVELLFCKTMQNGIFDLEINTSALDEPIRIGNQAVDKETLGQLEQHISQHHQFLLVAMASETENRLPLHKVEIKACETNVL